MTSRIVRDFLQRSSRFLLLGSALYLVMSLLVYGLVGLDGFDSILVISGILLAGVTAGVHDFELRDGLTRVLLRLPIDRRALAKTYWTLAVGVPTAWVSGLTLIAWLATTLGGGVGWISVPMAVVLAFVTSGLYFCMGALENSGRKYGGESPPRLAQVAMWALLVMAWLTGEYVFFGSFLGSFYLLLSPDAWQLKHLLVLLAMGAAASTLGFARTHSLLTARRAHSESRWVAPGPAIRKGLPLARNLTGFAAITASCLWMPIAIVGALGGFFAFDLAIRYLLGLSDSHPRMDWSSTVAGGALLTSFVVMGFATTVPRFANFRMLKGLPVSTRRLGACVTLLPAILVLIQIVLAFPLLHALDPLAATNLSFPLAGAVGIGALLCPALLVRPQQDIVLIAALLGISVLVTFWLTLSARVPVLQVFAPPVLAAGLLASWALSNLAFRYALAATDKPLPLLRVSLGGNA